MLKKEIRKKFTLGEFAKRIGLSRQYLDIVLKDKRLYWNYLPLICRVLGISLKQGLNYYEQDFQNEKSMVRK